ncbi:MAG: methyltransferase domain-containing protein [Actinomycetota bacterium]|nr:methyltransferase domain-containing protein [Actinomycetota bacterium]
MIETVTGAAGYVHPIAAAGFAATDAYEQARPSYVAEAVSALFRSTGIGAGADVVELGPGTGKLTCYLVAAGARVVPVEPVAEMRLKLGQTVPQARVVDATAEATTLPTGSARPVVAAQAFHWFAGDEALDEIHRLLGPGGHVGLIWAMRDERVPWVRDLYELIAPYEASVPRYRSGSWRSAFDRTELFTPLEEAHFGYDQEMDADRLVMRLASMSFIAVLPAGERQRVLDGAREVVADLGERFVLPHMVDVFWCARR